MKPYIEQRKMLIQRTTEVANSNFALRSADRISPDHIPTDVGTLMKRFPQNKYPNSVRWHLWSWIKSEKIEPYQTRRNDYWMYDWNANIDCCKSEKKPAIGTDLEISLKNDELSMTSHIIHSRWYYDVDEVRVSTTRHECSEVRVNLRWIWVLNTM